MKLNGSFAKAALTAAVCLVLGGCVSLLPKTKPVQLYRLSAVSAPASSEQAASSASSLTIARGNIDFDSAAATDRILTVQGSDAAYIAGGRWVSPAPVLFQEALMRAFQADPSAPHLVDRGGVSRANLMLSLDVQAFEARYDQGPDAAPQIVVKVHAVLLSHDDGHAVGEKTFTTTARADDNRIGAIVEAYNQALGALFKDMIGWSGGFAAQVAAASSTN